MQTDVRKDIDSISSAGMERLAKDLKIDALEAEVCRLRAVLLDLKFGADVVTEPIMAPSKDLVRYATEVKRVITGNLGL